MSGVINDVICFSHLRSYFVVCNGVENMSPVNEQHQNKYLTEDDVV